MQTWRGVYSSGSGCQRSGSLWDAGRFTPQLNERHLHTLITSALILTQFSAWALAGRQQLSVEIEGWMARW